jgi:hypothetical protein
MTCRNRSSGLFVTATAVSVLTAIGIGCGGSPGAATSNPIAPSATTSASALRILADPVVTLTTDEQRSLAVQEVDASGPVTRDAASYSWTSSDPDVVRVESAGTLHAGTAYGSAIVSVRSPAGPTATVRIWVQLPSNAASGYRVTLQFAADVPQGWRDALTIAAATWQARIRGDLPGVAVSAVPKGVCGIPVGEPDPPTLSGVERGTLIYVGQSRFPTAQYEAVGGPCVQRDLPRPTTVYGQIWLNRLDPVENIPAGHLAWLVLHEMGHVLGLVAVVQGVQPNWYNQTAGTFTGPLGLEGYRRLSGEAVSSLPVGSAHHWPFVGDVMSGQGTSDISTASIGALMDLGYPAFW